jgi:predicted O-methyltransferase YrrM
LYSSVTITGKYLRYLWQASSGRGHGVHSPFVYDFVEQVLNARHQPAAFARIEAHRRHLLASRDILEVEDFGAGSAFGQLQRRSVGSIARHAAKAAKFGRLLYRIAEHYRCGQVLELGTSLGISTAYMASAPGVARVLTLEGAPAVARAAGEGFSTLGLQQVEQILGNFDDTLGEALLRMPAPDLVFVDGNHRKEPTLRYFRECLAAAHEDTILLFDDIHWSAGMESAWAEIKADPEVRCTIDLFFVGIVLLRKAFHEQQHFVIRY